MVDRKYKIIAFVAIFVAIGLIIHACGSNEKSTDPLAQLRQTVASQDMSGINQQINNLLENQKALLENQKNLEKKINQSAPLDCAAVKNCLKKTPGQPHPHPTPTPKPPPPPPEEGHNYQERVFNPVFNPVFSPNVTVNCPTCEGKVVSGDDTPPPSAPAAHNVETFHVVRKKYREDR